MQAQSRFRRWGVLTIGFVVALALGIGLRESSRRRVAARAREQAARAIQAASASSAAAIVGELTPQGEEALGTIVPLLADERDAVAAAARDAIADLLARWESLAPAESSARIERLARELAAIAPRVPVSRREELHDLAARILVWPIEANAANASHVLAHCEAVLRLPADRKDEVRVATRLTDAIEPTTAPPAAIVPAPAPAAIPALPPAQPQPVLPPALVETPPAPEPPPFYGDPVEPERLIDASRERPEEPRQIRPPKAIKIDG